MMAAMNAAEIKVKVVPDFSEWDEQMAKKFPKGFPSVPVPLDDPLAVALLNHRSDDPFDLVVVTVGSEQFTLSQWRIDTVDGRTRLDTHWVPL